MASKADFSDEEWTRLKRAPFVAGMAISIADPGGPIEAVKETSATLKTVLASAEGGDHGDLVREIARETADDARHHRNPLVGLQACQGRDGRCGDPRRAEGASTASSRRRHRRKRLRAFAPGCSTSLKRPRTRRRRVASWASTPSV